MISRIPLTSRHMYRAMVASQRFAHYKNPYAKWHPAGIELIPEEHSPDPWTLDPEKIAKDHHHTLHNVPREFWPATLNEFPVPSMPWAQHHAEVQKRYNMQLMGAIILFLSLCTAWAKHPKIFWYTVPLDITDINWREESE